MTRIRGLIPIVGAAVVAAVTVACAPVTVTSFTERGVQVSRYRTYDWGTVDTAVPGDPRLDNNSFFHDYLRGAIDRQLRARGYEQTALTPDVRVHYHASAAQRLYISGSEPTRERCTDCAVQVYDEGTVLIDLVDGRTGALVWRGSAETDLARSVDDQARMERTLERVVERIFTKLPAHKDRQSVR
jgi:hypothetical protein